MQRPHVAELYAPPTADSERLLALHEIHVMIRVSRHLGHRQQHLSADLCVAETRNEAFGWVPNASFISLARGVLFR